MFHEGDLVLILSSDTKSAARRRVKPEISSFYFLGSTGGAVEASAVIVSHLARQPRRWTGREALKARVQKAWLERTHRSTEVG